MTTTIILCSHACKSTGLEIKKMPICFVAWFLEDVFKFFVTHFSIIIQM